MQNFNAPFPRPDGDVRAKKVMAVRAGKHPRIMCLGSGARIKRINRRNLSSQAWGQEAKEERGRRRGEDVLSIRR